jgi:hypothetical protein
MKNFRARTILPMVFLTIVFTAAAAAESLHVRVAESYGVKSFADIEAIRFTFNVDLGEKKIARSWVWEPQSGKVTFGGPGGPFEYNRSELDKNPTDEMKKIDAWFINDQYWLLFPLHLVWDDKAAVEDTGEHNLPMGNGKETRLVVSYPPSGGYTPGDVYELFIDDNNRISQWVYRRGGSAEPTRVTTWEDHRKVGPLTVSFKHEGNDGKFRLWFTDFAVKLKSSESWVEAG